VEPVQASPRFSCSGPISRHYANRRIREACPIDCMKILDNMYGNGSMHVIRRVKHTEMLNWGEFVHSVAAEQLLEH
jgi:hypothetical protein